MERICATCGQPITEEDPIRCDIDGEPLHDDCCCSSHEGDYLHLCETHARRYEPVNWPDDKDDPDDESDLPEMEPMSLLDE